jgi:hypothetical protein
MVKMRKAGQKLWLASMWVCWLCNLTLLVSSVPCLCRCLCTLHYVCCTTLGKLKNKYLGVLQAHSSVLHFWRVLRFVETQGLHLRP